MKVFTGKMTKTLICCCMRRPFFKTKKKQAGPKAICLSNGEISTEQENMRVLFKYQPADRILREIHAGIGKVAGSMDTKSIWRGESRCLPCILLESSASDTICTDNRQKQLSAGKKLLYLNF